MSTRKEKFFERYGDEIKLSPEARAVIENRTGHPIGLLKKVEEKIKI